MHPRTLWLGQPKAPSEAERFMAFQGQTITLIRVVISLGMAFFFNDRSSQVRIELGEAVSTGPKRATILSSNGKSFTIPLVVPCGKQHLELAAISGLKDEVVWLRLRGIGRIRLHLDGDQTDAKRRDSCHDHVPSGGQEQCWQKGIWPVGPPA
jgi:hypothetical protein